MELVLSGQKPRFLKHLACDFNGTLAANGIISRGVSRKLMQLSKLVKITILTSDTYGTARSNLRRLPVRLCIISTGKEKRTFVESLRSEGVIAVGNGYNDIGMFRAADFGIAVLGPEGLAGKLISVADVVAVSIDDALDLLLQTKRLTATLRT